MHSFTPSIAQLVSPVPMAVNVERTGHARSAGTVVMGVDTAVVALRGILPEAERAVSLNPEGAALVQVFELVTSSPQAALEAASCIKESEHLTGVGVEATSRPPG